MGQHPDHMASMNALFGERNSSLAESLAGKAISRRARRTLWLKTRSFFSAALSSLAEISRSKPSVCDWIHKTLGRLGGKRRKKHRRERDCVQCPLSRCMHLRRPLLYFRAACAHTQYTHIMPAVSKYSQRLNGARLHSRNAGAAPQSKIFSRARGNAPINFDAGYFITAPWNICGSCKWNLGGDVSLRRRLNCVCSARSHQSSLTCWQAAARTVFYLTHQQVGQ